MDSIILSFILLVAFLFALKSISEYRKYRDFKRYGTGIPGAQSSVITSYTKDLTVESQSKPT